MSAIVHNLIRSAASTANSTSDAKAKALKAQRKKQTRNGSFLYPWYIECGVIGACMLVYVYSLLRAYYVRRRGAKIRQEQSAASPGVPALQSKPSASRVPAAVYATFANFAYVRAFPVYLFETSTAAEWFFTAAYTGVVIGVVFWAAKFQGKMNYSNGCGMAAFGQVPIIIGLASRNNAISWLTGVSYEKLNYLHRASGRVCVLMSWIHAMSWVQRGLAHDVMPGDPQFAAGVVGLAGLTVMFLTSFAFIRRVMYEAFILVHIGFCLMFIIGVHYHWPKFGWWVYAGLIVWGADRFVGLCRLVLVNLKWIFRRKQDGNCTAELVDSKVVRLTFNNRPLFRWGPGQHAFISIPAVARLRYEQHPFTIINVPDEEDKVVFIVRAQKGFTRHLVDKLESASKTDLNLGAYLEGPYGISHNFNHYDTVILVAGGTGITFACSHLLAIIKAAREGSSAVSHVRLVWNVRDGMHMSWIAPLVNAALAKGKGNLRVSIDAYVTRSQASAEPATDGNPNSEDPDPNSPVVDTPSESRFVSPMASTEEIGSSDGHTIVRKGSSQMSNDEKLAMAAGLTADTAAATTFHHGRSHLEGILRLDVEASTRDAAGVVMAVCGPTALTLDARRAVCSVNSASAILRGQNSVELHTETFGW